MATREGRRQLAIASREETAFGLSEPKKTPPKDDHEKGHRENSDH